MCRVLPHSMYGKMDHRKSGLSNMSRPAWNPMDDDNQCTVDPYKTRQCFFQFINTKTDVIDIVFESYVFYLQIF